MKFHSQVKILAQFFSYATKIVLAVCNNNYSIDYDFRSFLSTYLLTCKHQHFRVQIHSWCHNGGLIVSDRKLAAYPGDALPRPVARRTDQKALPLAINSLTRYQRLLRDSLFTDFTIEVQGHSIRVHRSFLHMQSGYFRKLLVRKNRVGKPSHHPQHTNACQEVAQSKVIFIDIEPSLVARLITFCYVPTEFPIDLDTKIFRGVFQAPHVGTVADSVYQNFHTIELASRMYALGDRFDMPELCAYARIEVLKAYYDIGTEWRVPVFSFKEPEKISSFIRHVYCSTPQSDRGLRDVVFKDLKGRFDRPDEMHNWRFLYDLVEEIPDLAVDLARLHISEACYVCLFCAESGQIIIKAPCLCRPAWSYSCVKDECVRRIKARSFCTSCYKLGTIDPTTV